IQVKPSRSKDLCRETELLAPVTDDLSAEESLRPTIHLSRHLFGDAKKKRISRYGHSQIALVVERHRVDLSKRVFPIEHPAVRPGQQRVSYVAKTGLDVGPRSCCWPGPLDPLAV